MAAKSKTKNPRRLPRRLHQFFWEVDSKKVHLDKHADYIIARLLEHGDLAAIRWLLTTYTERQIAGVVKQSRQLSRKTANFWRLRLGIPESDVLALSRSYLLTPEPFY
jgi:hypothetical protein